MIPSHVEKDASRESFSFVRKDELPELSGLVYTWHHKENCVSWVLNGKADSCGYGAAYVNRLTRLGNWKILP